MEIDGFGSTQTNIKYLHCYGKVKCSVEAFFHAILYIYSIYVFYERKLINLREVCLIVRDHVIYYSANNIMCTI